MYKIFLSALSLVNNTPAMTISEELKEAAELSMRFAETFAEKGFDTVLLHETGNPDMPEEIIHYVREAQFIN